MTGQARINDIDAIRAFRAHVIKFMESANAALSDADSEILRKINWLEGDQDSYWVQQVRKWTEEVARARDAVRQKRIFKDALGRQQSTVDEEKKLKICQARLEECETKLANTRKHARALMREHLLYRGTVQSLSTHLSADMPNAVAMLDSVTTRLQQYIAAGPAEVTSSADGPTQGSIAPTDAGASMSRPADPMPPQDEKTTENSSTMEETPAPAQQNPEAPLNETPGGDNGSV